MSLLLLLKNAAATGVVAFRSSSNTGNAVSVTSRAPAVPAGAAAGDIAVVFLDLWDGSADPTVTPPSGFTQKYKVSAGTGVKAYCFWKRLTGADSGTYSFTWGATAMYATANVTCVSGGISSGDPIGSNFNTATATSATFPNTTVSPSYNAGLLWHGYNDSVATHTPPTGYTESIDVDCATDAYLMAVAGGPYTATAATASVSSAIVSGLVAIEPEPGGGDTPKTASDSAALSDPSPILAGSVAVTDSGAETDVASLSVAVLAVDSAALSEGMAALAASLAGNDSTAMSEVAALLISLTASDSMLQTEAATALVVSVLVNDSASQAESPTLLTQAFLVTDSIALTESPSLLAQSFSVTDTQAQTEGTATYTASVNVSDSYTLSDTAILDSGGTPIVGSESTTLTEAATSVTAALSVSDAITLSDVSALLVSQLAVDSATQSDAAAALVLRSSPGIDSATQTEGAVVLVVNAVASDLAIQDELVVAIIASLARADASTFADISALQVLTFVVETETFTLGEIALLEIEDEDQSEFTTIKIYLPGQNPVTRIMFNGS